MVKEYNKRYHASIEDEPEIPDETKRRTVAESVEATVRKNIASNRFAYLKP